LQETGVLEKYEGVQSSGTPVVSISSPVPLHWERAEKVLGFKIDRAALSQRLGALGFRE